MIEASRGPHAFRPAGLLCAAIPLAAGLLVAGCFFDGGKAAGGGGSWDDFPNPKVNQCGEITPDQMGRADALVEAAGPHFASEAEFLLGDSARTWKDVHARDLPGLQGRYAAAVAAAPGHCGALFGHAVTTALSVLSEPRFDTLVREADAVLAARGAPGAGGAPALAKLVLGPALHPESEPAGSGEPGGPQAADGRASALFKLRRGLAAAEPSLITRARETAESLLLPKIDSAIAGLGKVVANPDFRFEVDFEGGSGTRRLDRGEAAPLLGSLKAMKAVVLLVAGYEWRAESDEVYPHAKVLADLRLADFDSLTGAEVEALDRYTALFGSGSAFTRIRSGWESAVASIPVLLDEAVGHAQAGLAYGIEQAEQGLDQRRDPYVVGVGEDADVDPADLRKAIDGLERARKYLRGEALLVFAAGKDTLRVDFPRLFRVNGLQGLLPYFKWHPYPEWNDSVATEGGTRLLGPLCFTDASRQACTLQGYEFADTGDISGFTGRITFPDPTFGGVFPGLTNENFWPTLKSLLGERSEVARDCPAHAPEGPGCAWKLPPNPSDLDLIDYYLFKLGR